MWKNFCKTLWRSLLKDRQFTFLNLMGLSIGLACTLLIFLWVQDERSVDKFHANDSGLYQVMAHINLPDGIHTQESTPMLLGRSLAKEMPEVEGAVSVQAGRLNSTISAGDKHIRSFRWFADKDLFRLFSFRLLEGNKDGVLADKYSVVLSDKLAMKLFNSTHVTGKTVQWADDPQLFTVTGVFQSPGANSSMHFDLLFSYEFYYQQDTANANNWANSNPSTYLLVKEGTKIPGMEKKLTAFLHAKYSGSPLTLSLRKYSDRYLHGQYENGVAVGGRIRYVRLFSIIGVFILLMACINFMNLSTAKAAGRMKQAGIKKVLGAGRGLLVLQYMGESMLLSFLSLIIALGLVAVLLSPFNVLTGKQMALPMDVPFFATLAGIGFITGLLAGCYPAFYLSGGKSFLILKGKFSQPWKELLVRKGLVVFQYSLCVLFIVAVLVVGKQVSLIQNIDLGYKKDNIIAFQNEKHLMENFRAFAADVSAAPGVQAISSFNADMYGSSSGSTEKADWEGNVAGAKVQFTALDVDYGLIELLGMKMAEGRSFSRNFGSDSLSIIVNQAAVEAMGMKNPIGKSFDVWGGKYHIVGVVKDFHFESLYEKVKPCFMRCNPSGRNVLVKIEGGKERETIAQLDKLYKRYNLGLPFEFTFMDQDYAAMYASEEHVSVLLRWFTVLAIVISSLGLFGLAAFSAQKRQKEMSIRKVVGASAGDLALVFSMDFLKLVLIAVSISFPLSWWAMNDWLHNFSYRVDIGVNVFAVAFLAILLITLVTIGFQSMKAALVNPATSLRGE
ncbi:MAG TPA: ABC transporter permease [Puia sp.]|nr:ABC transporter permease [Puia sp.]